ncbi:hypothetical protein ACFPN7_25725 [Amycolatopsis halotolerans]
MLAVGRAFSVSRRTSLKQAIGGIVLFLGTAAIGAVRRKALHQ